MIATARIGKGLVRALALAAVMAVTVSSVGGTAQGQTPPTLEPPDAPGAPTLTARQGGIDVRWSKPANEGSGPIYYYDIRWTERDAGWDSGTLVSFFGNLDHLDHTIWGAKAGTEYEVQVRAVNQATYTTGGVDYHYQLEGDWSPSAYATVPPVPEPAPEAETGPYDNPDLTPVYDDTGKLVGYEIEEIDPEGKDNFQVCKDGEMCNNPDYAKIPDFDHRRDGLAPPTGSTECWFEVRQGVDDTGVERRWYIAVCDSTSDSTSGTDSTLECKFTLRQNADGSRAYVVSNCVEPDPLPYRCIYGVGHGQWVGSDHINFNVIGCTGTPPTRPPMHEREPPFCYDSDGNVVILRSTEHGCWSDPANYEEVHYEHYYEERDDDGNVISRELIGIGRYEPIGKKDFKDCEKGAPCNEEGYQPGD